MNFRKQFHVVHERPLQVERLYVPEPAFYINDYCLDICRAVFTAMADAAANLPRYDAAPATHLFLSRARLNGPPHSEHEKLLQAVAASEGFVVIHPQTMLLSAQIDLVARATAIAGVGGSTMHLTAFCKPGTRVFCFDTRQVRNQAIIEQLMGLDARHFDLSTVGGMPEDRVADRFREVLRGAVSPNSRGKPGCSSAQLIPPTGSISWRTASRPGAS